METVIVTNRTTSESPTKRRFAGDNYPIREGEPTETDRYLRLMISSVEMLDNFFACEPDVYAAAIMTPYYEKDSKNKFIAPDVMVIKGISKEFRRNF